MAKALVLALAGMITAVLLLGLKAWIPWLTKHLLRIAILRLPEDQRGRFSEEWASHINEVTREISKVAVALGYIFASQQMASLLKSGEPSWFHRVRDDYKQMRVIDIAGSLLALVSLAPVFLAIACVVKATSKGPVLFRQRRIGQYGNSFVFLKFRFDVCGQRCRCSQKICSTADCRQSR